MATAEEGGATASAYGGGGAGGKFRKKPFRRQPTPYDRPPTALRVSNINSTDNNSSWLKKLVVEPASKLISYGADRFFGSVLRRRLPPPPQPQPQPQPPEVHADVSEADHGEDLDVQDGAQEPENGDCRQPINSSSAQDGAHEPGDGNCGQPINSSSSNVVLELEQLFKKKTFNRSEIVHLTELLQSRAVDVSLEDVSQKYENASEFGRRREFANGLLKVNRNVGIRSSAVVSTPVHNSKVLEDSIATPAELAKAYMGSRPSKVSPSELGMRGQLGREEAGLLTNLPFASKSPVMSLTKKSSMSLGAPENGFVTPRSRSRSAIYNMARTPYSRVHPASVLKGSGSNYNGYAGPSASSYLPPVKNNEKFEPQPATLKRRSSVFDDEVVSVGPMRRIRQKSNLLAPRFHHSAQGVGVGPHSKQRPELMGDRRNDSAMKNIVENETQNVPSTSYARVPSRSSEVAAKILQQLEKLSPKEKSSESKLVAAREKWPLKSTAGVLSGQAHRSREDVGSSKLLLDDQKFGDNAMLPDARDSSPWKQVNAEENYHNASIFSSGPSNSVLNNDSAVTLRTSKPSIGTADLVKTGVSQPPQKKRAFRMSAEEDSLEQGDVQCNGIASRSPFEKKEPVGSLLSDSKRASDEEYKLVKPTIESEDKSPSGLISRGTNEFSQGAVTAGERMGAVVIPASEERATSQSASFVSSYTAFDKPAEANNSPPQFSFSPKVSDKFPPLPVECTKRAETEPGSSSSLDNISASIGSRVKTFESDKGFHLNLPKAGDMNGKCDDVSSAAPNGPLVSSFSHVPFPTNQISTGSAPLFSSSSSFTDFTSTGTSTSTTAIGNIFGSSAKPFSLAGPVFGSSVDSSTAVSATSISGISEVADQRTKVEINPSSGSSSSSHSTVAAASSGNSNFGLSSVNSSTGNNFQGSLFGSSNSKSLMSGVGSVSQGSSSQLFSATSAPAFNVNTSTSLGSSPTLTFGFSSSASSLDPNPFAPVGGPTSSSLKFGANTSAASEGSAASFTTSASPGIYSFGLSTSSSTTTTVAASPSIFNFGGTSSAAASGINTGSSFSSGTSGIYNFGGNSSASSSSSGAPSTAFSSSWQGKKSPFFGSTVASPSPSTVFAFGAPSTSSAVASPSPQFSFTASSASALSSPALSNTQPIFGKSSPMGGGFAASPGNDQMSAEDSMAEDPVPSSVIGQSSVSPSPPGFTFGPTAPAQANMFLFSGQQNQVAPQSPSPFQASGSLEFNAGGGSFSLGSGGVVDKSNRKIVRINRNKNRKK
ncbi:hypothetical protein ACS0TY_000813 [Phlomoides rotata]